MSINKQYKAIVIGLGRVGAEFDDDKDRRGFVYSHCGAYNACNRTKLIAVCDIDKEKVSRYANKYDVKGITSVDEIIDADIDIVSIATPAWTHLSLVKECIDKLPKIKVIYLEKPIAHTYDDAEDIATLSYEYKLPIVVNLQRNFSQFHNKLEKFFKSGQFGKVENIICNYGGGILNTGSHIIDLVLSWFDDFLPGTVRGWANRNEMISTSFNDPNLFGSFELHNGAMVTLIPHSQFGIFEIVVTSDRGRLIVGNPPYTSYPSIRFEQKMQNFRFKDATQLNTSLMIPHDIAELQYSYNDEYMINAINHICNIIEKNEPVKSNVHAALKSFMIIDSITTDFLRKKLEETIIHARFNPR